MTNLPQVGKPPVLDMAAMERAVVIDYTNYKGERGKRMILPIRWQFITDNEYHPGPNWLLHAWDFAKRDYRQFAMTGIHQWLPPKGNDDAE